MRIASLLPSATEILFALGAGDRVVGVTHECDFPPEAVTRPHLTASALPDARDAAELDRHVRASLHAGSSLYHLDRALLERLHPDLIVTQELCAVCAVSYDIVSDAARRLRSDPRILSLEPSSLDDVYATVLTLGDVSDTRERAQQLVESLRTRIDTVQRAIYASPRRRTLLLEWTQPPYTPGHWTPELLELAGGQPVLASPRENASARTWAEIAASQPEIVIVAPCGYGLERTREETRALEALPEWNELDAVRRGEVYLVDGNAYVNRPGPRLVDTVEIFAQILHPQSGIAPPDARAWERYRVPADDVSANAASNPVSASTTMHP